ncbi:8-amino-7-oxononanoate synthase [Methylobacillus flagellatus]|uniref:8-amino-7-oxononanoate synthase n=1 Tax=Methylobacillus flagellatus TaxID=405 RepID=UPI0028539CAD|nr:8-amino-7-oxononanoate synthase [Methylobacillus flagellatus]MDR5172441.1 8-amino-7-oxononanoate synthase [Methylobacillus flagellatus]
MPSMLESHPAEAATPLLDALQTELAERADLGLLRQRRVLQGMQGVHVEVDGKRLLSFCSNDYLGLAAHPSLISAMRDCAATVGAGAGASHLVTGHQQAHEALEHALQGFMGLPGVLLFTTGYMANLGIITSLCGREDVIFADKLNHASLNDAALLSRAELKRYAHNDLASLERLLAQSQARRKLVVADAVFSMDGDLAPVPELLALCERYDAYLMLDDAHGFGVLGANGRGVLEHFALDSPRIIYMATLGKAAGAAGAFVAGPKILTDYLMQTARPYIYTTASPAPVAAAAMTGVQLIEQDHTRRAHLHALIADFRTSCRLQRWQLMASETAIQPVVIGSNEEVLQVSKRLLESGILVPAIRPPTVPKGTARLRISLSAAHTHEDVRLLLAALHTLEAA